MNATILTKQSSKIEELSYVRTYLSDNIFCVDVLISVELLLRNRGQYSFVRPLRRSVGAVQGLRGQGIGDGLHTLEWAV